MLFASFSAMMDQGGPAAAPAGGSFLTAIIPFVLVFVIFYLLIIMPSRRKQKKHQEMVEQMKPGDKIITTGGIYGTVMGTQQDRIELKIAANTKIDITKNAVAVILGQKTEAK
jgi:preprotein translocase subunit YajC